MHDSSTAALDTIRAKLARGDELLAQDLDSLKAVHCMNNNHDNFHRAVPYLNRSFLNHAETGRLPQLVRYVGMVQDMMDPEYYTSKDSQGRSLHFRDDAIFVNDNNEEKSGNHDMRHDDLAERIPLVVVPLPYASDWLLKGLNSEILEETIPNQDQTSSPQSVAYSFEARKRSRDLDEEQEASSDNYKRERGDVMMDEAMEGTGGDAITTSITTRPTDWWPPGTCGSSKQECPVLAKFCYDQLHSSSQEQRRLMLNDIVSMVGVLSVNPWEADFSKQRSVEDEWLDCGWGEDFAPSLPPPSLLPRLHVLSYERLDLDGLAQRALKQTKNTQMKKEEAMDITENNSNTITSSTCPETLLSLFDDQSNPKETQQVAQALWMCLLSKADRRSSSHCSDDHMEMFRAGPMEQALGCLSLQLSMPDTDRSRDLFQHLGTILPAICPLVATVDFSRKNDVVQLGMGPGKDANGRLKHCPFQLPAGSVLLVHYHPKSSCATEAGTIAAVKGVLHELVQHHRLPYRFEGDVVLPFEADYRVVVVTTQTTQLPCTLSILSKDRTTARISENREETYAKLREMLSSTRSAGTKQDVKLSEALMERAQQDFMTRRRDAYELKQQQQASGRPSSSSLPDEDDFHRWLTMTKIQTRSRYSLDTNVLMEAMVEDWEIALKLDDASQKMMTPTS